MITQVLANTAECRDGNCPTVRETDRNSVIIQGGIHFRELAELEFPEGEGAVEVPIELMLRAAAAYLEQA